MKYILTNGDRYIYIKPNGTVDLTSNKNIAFRFKSLVKAQNVIITLPKTMNNPPIYIEKTADVSTQNKPAELDMNYLPFLNITEFLKDIEYFFQQIELYKPFLENEIKTYEDMLLDIEHFIELEKINAVQSCKLIKQIKEIRNNRRNAKDKLFLINGILQTKFTKIKDGTFIRQIESNLSDRAYTPRILTDLFN